MTRHTLRTGPRNVAYHSWSVHGITGPGFHPVNTLMGSMEEFQDIWSNGGWYYNSVIQHEHTIQQLIFIPGILADIGCYFPVILWETHL